MKKPKRSRRHRRSADVAAKATAYSLATGATLCLASDAAGAPIQYVPPGGTVSINAGESFSVNFDGGDVDVELSRDFSGAATADAYLGGFPNLGIIDTLGNGSNTASLLTAGEQVGTDISGWEGQTDLSEFINKRGFLGLLYNGSDDRLRFAYLDISIAAPGSTLTLYGGAFESDPFTAITIVPEPSGLALLALGAVGLATRRRKEDVVAD